MSSVCCLYTQLYHVCYYTCYVPDAAVAASVTVVVVVITLGTIIIIILGIAYFVRKRYYSKCVNLSLHSCIPLHRRKVTSATQHDDLVTMPNEHVVGGEMRFKSESSLILLYYIRCVYDQKYMIRH